MESIDHTIRNFNGKPDFVGCLLVKNGLWPADFSIMYTYYKYKMFKTTLHCREVRFPGKIFHSVAYCLDFSRVKVMKAEPSVQITVNFCTE